MFRSKGKSLALAVVLVGATFVCVADAQAGWWHGGGWGYGGGWGCCGSPGYYSTGWYTPYVSYVSYGWGGGYGYGWHGCGWRGCGWRGCGWGGCYRSVGCCDSCWDTYSYGCGVDTCCGGAVATPAPSYGAPRDYGAPTQAPTPAPEPNSPGMTPTMPDDSGSTGPSTRLSVPANSGMVTLQVPSDATVYVNGYRTKSTGTQRKYVSNGLKPGMAYKYEIRAEMVRDGRTIEDTRVVYLRAGNSQHVAINFDAKPEQQIAATW